MPTIDHNYGGEDALAYQNANGIGIELADLRIFRKEDWDAGNRSNRFMKARLGTTAKGHWGRPVDLPPGRYILVFSLPGQFGPDSHDLTVAG